MRCLISPLPLNNTGRQRPREQTRVVCANNVLAATHVPELELSDESHKDSLQLQISELLTDTPVATGAEGKVWRVGSLRDDTPAVVNGVLGASLRLLLVVLAGIPSVRVPNLGVDEMRVELRRETRRRHECVRGGNDVVGAICDKGLLDLAHDGMDGSVKTEGLLDDLSMQSQLGEILVGKSWEILSKSRLLLRKKVFNKTRVLSQTEENPGDS